MATLTEEQKQTRKEARQRAQQEAEERQARQTAALQARYAHQYRRYRDWETTEDRLRSLVPKALGVLEKALGDEADPKQAITVAVAVLRAAGLNGLERPPRPSRLGLALEEVDADLEDVSAAGWEVTTPGPVDGA